ncbi:MAG: hypothetical protein JJ934_19550 [Pseudomonadales bacterium]|nr:hypothetical protein [Pseudomonadales bacterium]MBO6659092.1 hypothetical protein [Pseudomonadales bacterium]
MLVKLRLLVPILAFVLLSNQIALADADIDSNDEFVYPEALSDDFQVRADAAREKFKDNFWVEVPTSPELISYFVMQDVIREKSASKTIPSLRDFELSKGSELTRGEKDSVEGALTLWRNSSIENRSQLCASVKDENYDDLTVVNMWYGGCPECDLSHSAYSQISESAGPALKERLASLTAIQEARFQKRPWRMINPDYLAEIADILRVGADHQCLKSQAAQGGK